MNDREAMQRALELALRGTGHVSPNPRVGCVITRDGELVSEGWHARYGGPHAEAAALAAAAEAGDSVAGATLYSTLEPCNHQGKRGPCTQAIIAAGIGRVVIGAIDKNPIVNGAGAQVLRDAGIEVETGVMRAECEWQLRAYQHFAATGRPYIIAKAAQSLDGSLAAANGQSKWISGEESRTRAHRLRREVDAVLVGATTVKKDDPELTVRMVEGPSPRRVVLDTNMDSSLRAKLFVGPDRFKTFLFTSESQANGVKANALSVSGIKIRSASTTSGDRLDLENVLEQLAGEGIASILVEGGAQVLSSFMAQDLVDELHLFVAPMALGEGKGTFAGLGALRMENAPRMHFHSVGRSGEDLHIIALRGPRPAATESNS